MSPLSIASSWSEAYRQPRIILPLIHRKDIVGISPLMPRIPNSFKRRKIIAIRLKQFFLRHEPRRKSAINTIISRKAAQRAKKDEKILQLFFAKCSKSNILEQPVTGVSPYYYLQTDQRKRHSGKANIKSSISLMDMTTYVHRETMSVPPETVSASLAPRSIRIMESRSTVIVMMIMGNSATAITR